MPKTDDRCWAVCLFGGCLVSCRCVDVGVWVVFDKEGKKESEFSYEDQLSNDGILLSRAELKNGKKTGLIKTYSELGFLIAEERWIDKKLHGLFQEYWPNGKLKRRQDVEGMLS